MKNEWEISAGLFVVDRKPEMRKVNCCNGNEENGNGEMEMLMRDWKMKGRFGRWQKPR